MILVISHMWKTMLASSGKLVAHDNVLID